MIYHDPWRVAEIRIPRLFAQLEQSGYPYDFLPVMISGLRCDNAPPNVAILDQVNRWNDVHGREITVEMVTLDQFFARLRSEQVEIPVYAGDWPDWWTDGVASLPPVWVASTPFDFPCFNLILLNRQFWLRTCAWPMMAWSVSGCRRMLRNFTE